MRRLVVSATATVVVLAACSSSNGGSTPTTGPSTGVTTTASGVPTPRSSTSFEGTIVFGLHVNGTDADGAFRIFALDRSDSPTQLLSQLSCCPIWSPDGTRIVVAAEAPDNSVFTATVAPDGSGFTRLPFGDATLNLLPGAWSPDGARIAYEGYDDTQPHRNGLYTVGPSDGSGLVRLTTSPGGRHDFPAAYSPDGSRILFFRPVTRTGDDSAPMDLFVMNANGTGLLRLNPPGTASRDRAEGSGASWSPDGRRVAFVASSGPSQNGRQAVFVVNADGTHPRRITAWGQTNDARWSPDGRSIAFTRSDPDHLDVFVVHPDGTGQMALTSSAGGVASWGVTWSPDSTKLLFVRESDIQNQELWMVNADGTGLAQITHSPGEYEFYSWAPSRRG